MNIRHYIIALSMLFLFASLFLSADRVGGRGDSLDRGDNPMFNYDNRVNYGGYGGDYGGGAYVGSPFYGEYINPYPPPGSMPGMSDDSNSLYNSYLQSNQNQGYFH